LWYEFPVPNVSGTAGSGPKVAPTAGRGTPDEVALRIGLSLPGGIAPGTFEAGAVSGLLAWIQEVNARQADTVLLDVIAGASAGSLSGLLAARVLLAGDDPVAVFREAWVEAPSLEKMRGTGPWAPLSLRPARDVAHRLLFAPSQPTPNSPQTSPITLNLALGCLRGFSQEIPLDGRTTDPSQPLLAASYLDWSSYELSDTPDGTGSNREEWTQAIDSAVASASHPLAFRARALDRTALRPEYLATGIINLPADPEQLRLWYTDGGLLDNEPLGRCVDLVGARDAAPTPSRLVMLVRSTARWPPPADNPAWSGSGRPHWTQTVARALDLVATHAAGRDLLRVEEVNAQLGWTNEAAHRIAEMISDDRQARADVERLLGDIEQRRSAFARIDRRPGALADPDPGSLADLIEAVLKSATGLAGKQPVEVAVVSPDGAFPGPQPWISLVAFLQRRQREANFAAGYWTMLKWIEAAQTLEKRLDPELIASAARAAGQKVREPTASALARNRTRRISIRTHYELFRLGIRTSLIARADLLAAGGRPKSPRKPAQTEPSSHRWRRLDR
jgi:predicted acylesterase/phospholipase RssA